MNIDTVRAAVRGQLKAIAATDLIVAQAVEDAIVAGIHVAEGGDPLAEPHLFTEAEVLAMSQATEVTNAEKRAADIAADPSLGIEAPLEVPAEIVPLTSEPMDHNAAAVLNPVAEPILDNAEPPQ